MWISSCASEGASILRWRWLREKSFRNGLPCTVVYTDSHQDFSYKILVIKADCYKPFPILHFTNRRVFSKFNKILSLLPSTFVKITLQKIFILFTLNNHWKLLEEYLLLFGCRLVIEINLNLNVWSDSVQLFRKHVKNIIFNLPWL